MFTLPLLALSLSLTEIVNWGLVTILSSAGLGFFAGRFFGSRSELARLARASRNIDQCCEQLLQSFRNARQICRSMQDFPELSLTAAQSEQLETEQRELMRTWKQCWERIVEADASDKSPSMETDFRMMTWITPRIDPVMGIPDRESLITNLNHLLSLPAAGSDAHGILLARLDNSLKLKLRFGDNGCQEFLKAIVGLVRPFIRTQDFICLASGDTIAVLFPGLDFRIGRNLAENLRNVIREHRFRLEEAGPEVLVTASLGYAVAYPQEHFELVRQRAENAVADARRMGRNQLCLHDGTRLVLCTHSTRPSETSPEMRTLAVPQRH
ncbi:MAG: GGDEF domain-containing protein [Planctomycetota bacterium]|nr:GGDEF domain-containing protein [Planctomycetota bacterium]MDA1214550.1 GGDEF domain-containing protein [Planctomycetota bacterium]